MKAWILIKCIVALILGAALLSGAIEILIGVTTLGKLIHFVACFLWFRYVLRFYYPRSWEN